MEKAKRIFKCISVFASLYCALLNAVVADNRYFKVFAILGAIFCAILLAYAFFEKAAYAYRASYSVLYFLTVISVIAGLFGNIDAYRCGALLLILLSVSELLRFVIRNKKVLVFVMAAVFVIVPLFSALTFIALDIKPELNGNAELYASEFPQNGEYNVTKRTYTTGRGASVIYYPSDKKGEAPVIAYLHGYYIYNTSDEYEDTLYYLASCGYIVLAPNYENMFLDPNNFTSYLEIQIRDGIKYAENTLDVKPAKKDGEYMLGLVGHSVGAVTALNFCAENRMKVGFVLALDASDGNSGFIPKRDLSSIGADVNVLMAVGYDDNDACFDTSLKFYNSLTEHDGAKKAFYVLYSDENGDEKVIADHNWMKDNGSTKDNLKRYGAHKWAAALAEWTFYGKDCDGWHSDAALDMGEWSDGTSVVKATSGVSAIVEKRGAKE